MWDVLWLKTYGTWMSMLNAFGLSLPQKQRISISLYISIHPFFILSRQCPPQWTLDRTFSCSQNFRQRHDVYQWKLYDIRSKISRFGVCWFYWIYYWSGRGSIKRKAPGEYINYTDLCISYAPKLDPLIICFLFHRCVVSLSGLLFAIYFQYLPIFLVSQWYYHGDFKWHKR